MRMPIIILPYEATRNYVALSKCYIITCGRDDGDGFD